MCVRVSLGYGFKCGDAGSWPMHTFSVKPHCQRWKSQFICLLTVYESSLCSTSSLASSAVRLKFYSICWVKICITMWFTFLFLWLLMRENTFPCAHWPLRFDPLSSVWYIFCLFFHHFLSFSCLFVRVLYISNTHVLYWFYILPFFLCLWALFFSLSQCHLLVNKIYLF